MLIDKSYFVGEINIPNTGKADVSERLDFFIAKYEDDFLTRLFGTPLYNAYKTGIAVLPDPDQMWIDLRDGVEYDINGITTKWFGLVNTTTKQSPIANYVYYWWKRSDNSAKPDDAEQQQAYYQQRNQSMVRAWNEMSEWIMGQRPYSSYYYSIGLLGLLNQSQTVYADWNLLNGYSAYEFFAPINEMNL